MYECWFGLAFAFVFFSNSRKIKTLIISKTFNRNLMSNVEVITIYYYEKAGAPFLIPIS